MTMFLLQALLWLLVAFLLGYGIGRFLKSLFCRPAGDAAAYSYKDFNARVNVPAAATVLGGAAAAVGAVAVARNKFDAKVDAPDVSLKMPKAPVMDWSGIDPHKPILNPPDMGISLPAVDVDLPNVSLDVPDVDLSGMSLKAPDVDLPKVSLDAPSFDIDLPTVDTKAPNMDWSGIDPHKPIMDLPDMDINLPAVDVDLPGMSLKMPEVDLPEVSMQTPEVSVDGAGSGFLDAAKVVVLAAGAGLTAKVASVLTSDDKELPNVSLDAPSFDVDLPTVDIKAPSMDWSGIDPHKPILNPPDMDIRLPAVDVDLPGMSLKMPEIGLPEVSLDAPSFDIKAPDLDWSGIDPHKPIMDLPDMDINLPAVDVDLLGMSLKVPEVDLPDVSLQAPDVSVDASGFLDTAQVAVVAAGTGLVVNAVVADEVSLDTHPDANWLLWLVQQTKEAYRGRNARAVSRLWGSDSHHDCSTFDDYESISLEPATYDKLGSSHCGVPRAGFVAVGGDVGNVERGSGILFHYCNIVVCRGADDTHHFIRVVTD